jgi:hypothetical protein
MADNTTPMDPQEPNANSDHLPVAGEFSSPLNVVQHDPATIDTDDTAAGASNQPAVTSESEGPVPSQEAVAGDALKDADEEDGPLGES